MLKMLSSYTFLTFRVLLLKPEILPIADSEPCDMVRPTSAPAPLPHLTALTEIFTHI